MCECCKSYRKLCNTFYRTEPDLYDVGFSNNFKFINMSILTIIVVILVVGVILWLINSYIPMQSTIKNILNAVVVIILVIWLLKEFGVLDSLQNVRI